MTPRVVRRQPSLTVAALPDPAAIRRAAARAGQAPHRPVGLRANLERFSDVETNWLHDLGRPRRSACARAPRRRAGLGADDIRRSRSAGAERCPAAACRRTTRSATPTPAASAFRRPPLLPRQPPRPPAAPRPPPQPHRRHHPRQPRRNRPCPTRGHTAAAAPPSRHAPAAITSGGRAAASRHTGRRRAAAAPAAGRSGARRGAPAAGRARQGQCRSRRIAPRSPHSMPRATSPLLWVTSDGFTAKATHAMAEIRKADDWGLTASAFELPHLAPGTAGAGRPGRRRDQARPRRPQVRPPRARRPPRPVADQQGHRRQADLPRSQGRAGGHGGQRDARQLPARPQSQARAVPEAAPGSAEGPQRPRQPRAGEDEAAQRAAARRTEPQGRQRARAGRAAAPAARPAAAPRRGEHLRPARCRTR